MAARVATFSAVATASSRSRITPSASSVSAFSTRRGWLPGANKKLRRRGMVDLLSKSLSALQGEREGPAPKAWEGEVGLRKRPGIPHLTPALSAPGAGEGVNPALAQRHLE